MFTRDGLNHLWNEMMKDGELVLMTGLGSSGDELPNSAGSIARRGNCVYEHLSACVRLGALDMLQRLINCGIIITIITTTIILFYF